MVPNKHHPKLSSASELGVPQKVLTDAQSDSQSCQPMIFVTAVRFCTVQCRSSSSDSVLVGAITPNKYQ